MPSELKTVVKYTYPTTLGWAASASSSFTLTLNGIFRPVSSSTRQPVGIDQLFPFYDAYVVTGARYKVSFMGTTAAIDDSDIQAWNIVCATIPVDETGELSSASIPDLINQAGSQYKCLGPQNGGPNSAVITGYVKPPTWLGRNQAIATSESLLRGTETSNPAENMYLRVAAGCMDGASFNQYGVTVLVDVEYEVTFYEPRSLSQSVV
jgi:hypothetical protein